MSNRGRRYTEEQIIAILKETAASSQDRRSRRPDAESRHAHISSRAVQHRESRSVEREVCTAGRVNHWRSHFLSEVGRLRLAAEALATGQRTLLLFDEVFRGTNFHDALETSSAVVAAFAQCRTSATIISSHAVELVPRIEAFPGVALRHFDMKLVDGVPVYTFRLEEGAFTGRMAMVLLAQEKLLDALGRLPPPSV